MSHQVRTTIVISGSISVFVVVYFTTTRPNWPNFTTNSYSQSLNYSNTSQSFSECNYVGFSIPTTGNGLGNHLFYYSGVLYVAWRTGRRPCIWLKLHEKVPRHIDEVFDIDLEYIDVSTFSCPYHTFKQKGVYVYDKQVESLIHVNDSEALWLTGAFASWKYTNPIATQLRRLLRFRQELTDFVVGFLMRNVPPGWTSLKFVRVGVHVRRGDFLLAWARSTGFTTADERYLQRAMNYFVERFPRVQFIVASNDIQWCQKHINVSKFNKTNVDITFSVGHNTGEDLALLSSCDHTIMTTGTYSWWIAWLANGITVYYANFPKPGSWLSTQIRSNEFYHPDWVGIGD